MMSHGKCYGSTVMGERGQVVIPAEAREEIGIGPGEKLIVFGNPNRGVIIIFKSEIMAKFADMMFKKASFIEEMFKGIHKRHDKKNRKPAKIEKEYPEDEPLD